MISVQCASTRALVESTFGKVYQLPVPYRVLLLAQWARRHTPHATPINPPPEQASVPLLLLAFAPEVPARVAARYEPALVDRTSTFEIFPTLLEAAGYAPEAVQRHYPFSLFDADADRSRRIFASGNIFAREGHFYIMNWLVGDVCYLNEFTLPEPPVVPGPVSPRERRYQSERSVGK